MLASSLTPFFPYVVVGVTAGGLAFAVLHMRRTRQRNAIAQILYGTDAAPASAPKPPKPPKPAKSARADRSRLTHGIDLSRPISAADWVRIFKLRHDSGYRQAVGVVRARYQIVANPLLLPNTIRETMDTYKVDLCEALTLIAQDRRVR